MVTFGLPVFTNVQNPPISVIHSITKTLYPMPIEESIREMEGKISLLDNRKFMVCCGLTVAYSLAWLGFLTHLIIQSGGF